MKRKEHCLRNSEIKEEDVSTAGSSLSSESDSAYFLPIADFKKRLFDHRKSHRVKKYKQRYCLAEPLAFNRKKRNQPRKKPNAPKKNLDDGVESSSDDEAKFYAQYKEGYDARELAEQLRKEKL